MLKLHSVLKCRGVQRVQSTIITGRSLTGRPGWTCWWRCPTWPSPSAAPSTSTSTCWSTDPSGDQQPETFSCHQFLSCLLEGSGVGVSKSVFTRLDTTHKSVKKSRQFEPNKALTLWWDLMNEYFRLDWQTLLLLAAQDRDLIFS